MTPTIASILAALTRAGASVARWRSLPCASTPTERVRVALDFLERETLDFPVIVKPDVGERGRGVTRIDSLSQLASHLEQTNNDQIVQEYIDGPEFGVFYVRHPRQPHGCIFSITAKRMPVFTASWRIAFRFGLSRIRSRILSLTTRSSKMPVRP